MASEIPEWCTIESDPGVFTELIQKFGVKDVQVEELWDLEDETFEALKPIYGLIFLFKWDQELMTKLRKEDDANILDAIPDELFFAKQTINNACATNAIVNILLNQSNSLDLGEQLKSFKEFSNGLASELRGELLNNSDSIREAHNSFARPEPISIEAAKDDDEKEDAFHFISYVPCNGFLYEIDGLQSGPKLICDLNDSNDENWYKQAKLTIQERIDQYPNKEIRFTLLAIVKDLEKGYKEKVEKLQNILNGNGMNVDGDNDANLTEIEIQNKITEYNNSIAREQEKKAKWKRENTRRRHNYFPLIFTILKGLASKGKLESLIKRAEEKKKRKN